MEAIFNRNELDPNQPAPTPELSPDVVVQLKSGASWFYWIAGLSLVNSLIFVFGGNVSFIARLAYTQIIDAVVDASILDGANASLNVVAIVLDFILVAIFALIGYYANKAISAVFIIGIIIYLIDGLLWLFLGSYFAVAFHAYALFMIIRGLMASMEINKFNSESKVGAFGG